MRHPMQFSFGTLALALLVLATGLQSQVAAQGRGRGGMQVMTLTAPWAPGAAIPLKFTQAGDDVSPALTWTDPPDGTGSFVLVVHDVSAPVAPGTSDTLHWLVWNIPATARSLPEAVPQGPQLADGTRQISVTGPQYRGPAAPASGPPHVYLFELFAVEGTVNVPALGPPGASVPAIREAVMGAIAGRVRGKAVMSGIFKRP
ncbi:MAG: YbhB/YbcL family Raf kinase inhibitor-like protein [Vicinamibacterales bacterium]